MIVAEFDAAEFGKFVIQGGAGQYIAIAGGERLPLGIVVIATDAGTFVTGTCQQAPTFG